MSVNRTRQGKPRGRRGQSCSANRSTEFNLLHRPDCFKCTSFPCLRTVKSPQVTDNAGSIRYRTTVIALTMCARSNELFYSTTVTKLYEKRTLITKTYHQAITISPPIRYDLYSFTSSVWNGKVDR